MTIAFQQVVEDLAAEHAALESVLVQMTPEAWELPTHAPGWLTRHQVAHLAHFDSMAALAMGDVATFALLRSPNRSPYSMRPQRRVPSSSTLALAA